MQKQTEEKFNVFTVADLVQIKPLFVLGKKGFFIYLIINQKNQDLAGLNAQTSGPKVEI